jgi:hypothetical protein
MNFCNDELFFVRFFYKINNGKDLNCDIIVAVKMNEFAY